ncbi:MAG: hypothetical protein AAF615_03975 [Pseudomonadota bacterium]
MSAEALEGEIERLLAHHGERLEPLGAGIMAAAHLGLISDSRTFARQLGIAHALVIRACTNLAEEDDFIVIERREERSQRLHYRLTAKGEALIREAA